jgi:hypothetical protein
MIPFQKTRHPLAYGFGKNRRSDPLADARGYFAEGMLLIGRTQGSPARKQGDHKQIFHACEVLARGTNQAVTDLERLSRIGCITRV